MSMPLGPELYLDNSSLCCSWTYLHYRGLCCTLICLHIGVWASPGRVCTTDSCSAHGQVSSTGPWAASGRVWTTVACAAPGLFNITVGFAPLGSVNTLGPELHLDVSALQVLCFTWMCFLYIWALDTPRRVYTTEYCTAPRHFYFTGPWSAPGHFTPLF
jgi:hypothetical protein